MSDNPHVLYETPADFKSHETTYHRFLLIVRYLVLAHLTAGAFYLLTVFTEANWLVAAVVAAALLAVGLSANRRFRQGREGPEAERLRQAPHALATVPTARPTLEPGTALAPEGQHDRAYDPAGRVVLLVLWALAVTAWAVLAMPSFLGILGSLD